MADTEKSAAKAELENVPVQKELHDQQMAHIKAEADHQLDHISEKHLLFKVDLHVVPILFVLFLCAFIDR
jgi:hypothetical protein